MVTHTRVELGHFIIFRPHRDYCFAFHGFKVRLSAHFTDFFARYSLVLRFSINVDRGRAIQLGH